MLNLSEAGVILIKALLALYLWTVSWYSEHQVKELEPTLAYIESYFRGLRYIYSKPIYVTQYTTRSLIQRIK
jgi:hypothetical protein